MNNKRNRNTILFVAFILLAGIINLFTHTRSALLNSVMFSANFAIYAVLIISWIRSVTERLLPTKSRIYIIASGVLMLTYLILRIFKYRISHDAVTDRYSDYLYWLPLLYIPCLFLMSAIRISRGETEKKLSPELKLLFPTTLLFILVLTNDLHNLVYIPQIELSSFRMVTGTYSYGIVSYFLYIWMAFMFFSAVILLFNITKKQPGIIMWMIMAILILWLSLELILLLLIRPSGLLCMYQSPEIKCFSMLALLEICIRSRLIAHNENYAGFFERLKLSMLITDEELKPVFKSAVAIDADEKDLKSVTRGPKYLNRDIKLNCGKIKAGYVFWTEDERELHELEARLKKANDTLSEENDLIKVENELKEKKAHLDAEAKVYKRINETIYPSQKRIEKLLDNKKPGDAGFCEALGEACVLNAYSKRKSNLLLIEEGNLPRKNRELFLALQETARFLECLGVEAAAVGGEYTDFSLSYVNSLYDTFQALVIEWLPYLKRLTVSITGKGIRVAVETTEKPQLPKTDLMVECAEEDGFTFLSIYGKEGTAHD